MILVWRPEKYSASRTTVRDASLQAGHFNDFIQVGLIRSAIYRALPEDGYLDHSNIATEVVNTLDLPQSAFAKNPGTVGIQPKKNLEAFIAYIEYRIYQDLRRGWRLVQPNLEQCGLLRIEYPALAEVCQEEEHWKGIPVISEATPEIRLKVANGFLNHLRHSLAIDADCLRGNRQVTLGKKVNAILREPWTFDEGENLHEGKWFCLG